LSALVPAFCLAGGPPWADMPLLQEPVCDMDREDFCPPFSGSSGSPEEPPFHLPAPSLWLSNSSSVFFSSSGLSQVSSIVVCFSASVFSYKEKYFRTTLQIKICKCELGTGKHVQITGENKEALIYTSKELQGQFYFYPHPHLNFINFSHIILTCTY
jgi:hypothetical protein